MRGPRVLQCENWTLDARARSLQSDARRRGPPRASLLIFRSRSAVLPARACRTSALGVVASLSHLRVARILVVVRAWRQPPPDCFFRIQRPIRLLGRRASLEARRTKIRAIRRWDGDATTPSALVLPARAGSTAEREPNISSDARGGPRRRASE